MLRDNRKIWRQRREQAGEIRRATAVNQEPSKAQLRAEFEQAWRNTAAISTPDDLTGIEQAKRNSGAC